MVIKVPSSWGGQLWADVHMPCIGTGGWEALNNPQGRWQPSEFPVMTLGLRAGDLQLPGKMALPDGSQSRNARTRLATLGAGGSKGPV